MYTRDRVRLDADIYRPEAEGEFPVLLMRQPYGRAIASTVVYAHPRWYAAQGYLVVIQDVRGRGTSEGEFTLFTQEVADGEDTVHWAAQLPGSSGVVGMYGFSYQGMTQLYAAQTRPEALKVLCPGMLALDLCQDWAYENGAFCFQASLGWAVQLAAETARLRGDRRAYQILYSAARNLPFYEPSSLFLESLNKYAPSNFYQDWVSHPDPQDPYWQPFRPDLSQVDLPMLHIGGWFDPYLRGTLRLYRDRAHSSHSPQYLIIGPWGHLPWGRQVGSLDYGPDAISPVDRLQIRWFDQFLKGIDTGILAQPPVCLFEMGSNQWREFEQFPQYSPQSYYFLSDGLASIREDSGQLLPTPPTLPSVDIFVHDPWRPVPALGGHAALPCGPFERTALDSRSDVVTYTTPPLNQDWHLAGVVCVQVYCQSDATSFDLCAVLSEVRPDGTVYNFTQGYTRVTVQETPLEIPLQATCICIPQGSSVRLSLSAACFPAYPVNFGGETNRQTQDWTDAQIMTLSIQSSPDQPSQLVLPLEAKNPG